MKAVIIERGNGFPEVGEIVCAGYEWGEPVLLRILATGSDRIVTGSRGNYSVADVEPVDVDDVDDPDFDQAADYCGLRPLTVDIEEEEEEDIEEEDIEEDDIEEDEE